MKGTFVEKTVLVAAAVKHNPI